MEFEEDTQKIKASKDKKKIMVLQKMYKSFKIKRFSVSCSIKRFLPSVRFLNSVSILRAFHFLNALNCFLVQYTPQLSMIAVSEYTNIYIIKTLKLSHGILSRFRCV